MGAIDALSRGLPHNLDPSKYVVLQTVPTITDLFNLCDPTKTREVIDHVKCLRDLNSLLSDIVSHV